MTSELDYISTTRQLTEGVDPRFVREGMTLAQEKTWKVLAEIKSLIRTGMTEEDARKLSLEVFAAHGVTKHWHRPYVRFGPGTQLTFNDPIQKDYRLQENDPFYMDYGPVWNDPELNLEYEGDVGDTFVMGNNPEASKCAETARELFQSAKTEWKEHELSGVAIYKWLDENARARGYELVDGVFGHRSGDFPHHKYSKERLARIPYHPTTALWTLEVQLKHPTLPIGAFFEDLLVSS